MTAARVGTFELLRERIYHLDAAAARGADPLASFTEVIVKPGEYPIHRDGISTWWMMTGRINTGRINRLGDGMFTMIEADIPDGPEVTFPSTVYGPDEWADLLEEANPRYRIVMQEASDG